MEELATTPMAEAAQIPGELVVGRWHKQPDAPFGLLSARSERPTGCQAAEKRYELAPPHARPQAQETHHSD